MPLTWRDLTSRGRENRTSPDLLVGENAARKYICTPPMQSNCQTTMANNIDWKTSNEDGINRLIPHHMLWILSRGFRISESLGTCRSEIAQRIQRQQCPGCRRTTKMTWFMSSLAWNSRVWLNLQANLASKRTCDWKILDPPGEQRCRTNPYQWKKHGNLSIISYSEKSGAIRVNIVDSRRPKPNLHYEARMQAWRIPWREDT